MEPKDLPLAYTEAKIKKLCQVLVVDAEVHGNKLREELAATGSTFLGTLAPDLAVAASGLYVDVQPRPVRERFASTLKATQKLISELSKLRAHGPSSFFHLVSTAGKTEPRQIAGYHLTEITSPEDPSNPEGDKTVKEELIRSYPTSPRRLQTDLPLFEQTLIAGLSSLPADRGGPTPNLEFRVYIYYLQEIYEAFAKLPARENLTTDPKTGTFSGPFYDFVKLNLDLVELGHGRPILPSPVRSARYSMRHRL